MRENYPTSVDELAQMIWRAARERDETNEVLLALRLAEAEKRAELAASRAELWDQVGGVVDERRAVVEAETAVLNLEISRLRDEGRLVATKLSAAISDIITLRTLLRITAQLPTSDEVPSEEALATSA